MSENASQNPKDLDKNTSENNTSETSKDEVLKETSKENTAPVEENEKTQAQEVPAEDLVENTSEESQEISKEVVNDGEDSDTHAQDHADQVKPDAEPTIEQDSADGETSTKANEEQSDGDKRVEPDTEEDEHHKEIEEANAEDSEDADNIARHEIELKDYDAMSMDALVIEIEKLLKNEKVQAIREHVTQIKVAFDKKFNEVTEEKKDEFISEGGNFIDFHYSSPVKTKFNRIYFDYREKRDNYYKNLNKNLNENLKNRLALIEELKSMVGVGRDMKATFSSFKDLQERWKNAGAVPRSEYSQLWKNYHHHVERFYDFLHLDREFRDLDFQYNLDQKLKIIARAEELAQEKDINRAFRELQLLHKMWKEELGPVAKEYREEIWEKFSKLTKTIHDNRRAHFEQLDKEREKHLEVKLDIIAQIEKLANTKITSHKQAQNNIKIVQQLRDLFFTSGKVPQKDNEEVWGKFKEQVRNFNKAKNNFYKNQKQEQNDNLQKKLDLIKIAEDNKDSDDFETITPLMKKIQSEWKKIGFVPRKYSDKIWKEFKDACNHYFDRMYAHKNEENKEEFEAFKAKKDLLEHIRVAKLPKDKDEALEVVKDYISQWKTFGMVPYQKRYIEGKFNRLLDQLFDNLGIDRKEAELLKYENRIQGIEESNDQNQIYKEVQFLSNKINETQAKINQVENNLLFFSNADKNSPLVQEVHRKIDVLKNELDMWKIKLKKIKAL